MKKNYDFILDYFKPLTEADKLDVIRDILTRYEKKNIRSPQQPKKKDRTEKLVLGQPATAPVIRAGNRIAVVIMGKRYSSISSVFSKNGLDRITCLAQYYNLKNKFPNNTKEELIEHVLLDNLQKKKRSA